MLEIVKGVIMVFNIISIYMFVTVLFTMFMAAYVHKRSRAQYTRVLLILSVAVCFYTYGYSLELEVTSLKELIFWDKFQYIGIPFISALWLTIALMYTGDFYKREKLFLVLIYTIPLITFIARMTNGSHHLYLKSLESKVLVDRLLLIKELGPLSYLQMVHSLLMMIISVFVFLRALLKSEKAEFAKIVLMLMGTVFAMLGLVVGTFNPCGLYIDFTILALPFTCLAVCISILKYDFFEIRALAREAAFESNRQGMLLLNKAHRIIDYNERAYKIFNEIDVELSEEDVSVLFKDKPDILRVLNSQKTSRYDCIVSGKTKHYEIITEIIGDEKSSGYGFFKTIEDITQDVELNENLRHLAATDDLSGVYSRREFIRLGTELLKDKRHRDTYLLMMDLDNFKRVNDQYGHGVGDEVIREFGDLLKQCFRDTDIIGRLGGEEFAVVMNQVTEESAFQKADKFRMEVQSHIYHLADIKLQVTVSIGMSRAIKKELTLDYLLNQADMALYESKNNGRNQVTYRNKTQ